MFVKSITVRIIGIDENLAIDIIHKSGYICHISRRDSMVYTCTCDLNFNRIKIEIENSVVKTATIG